MVRFERLVGAAAAAALVMAGCGGEPTDPPPPPPPPPVALDCSGVAPVQLSVGQHAVIDPATTKGCIRVPAAGANGAEYIVVAASTSPQRTEFGVSGSYHLRAANPGASAAPPSTVPALAPALAQRAPSVAEAFHDHLRRLESQYAADRSTRIALAPSIVPAPPSVGNARTFKVCGDLQCNSFVDVTATARHVGNHAAIYMDNTVPTADTLQEADYDALGNTFDTWLYPFDSTNFGMESDIDNNQRIVILMTDAVNDLTPDCTNGRILGYFFGADLQNVPNSNQSEVFYTFVPKPATEKCSALSRQTAVNALKPTLVHELQHMISWNQRVIVRAGPSEQIWLNEALSHFAEELAGRQVPTAECTASGYSSCRSQYISSNIFNAYDYLENPEATFLVAPASSNATLTERGAGWLFLRWVIDQYATDTIIGADLTRQLVGTTAVGVSNIVGVTGGDFSTMVVEWLLASYLDDRADLTTPSSARLRYKSWGLRSIFEDPRNSQFFSGYPLVPPSTSGTYAASGTLRGGSGRHLLLTQAANGAAIDVQLVRNTNGDVIDPNLVPRLGIARTR